MFCYTKTSIYLCVNVYSFVVVVFRLHENGEQVYRVNMTKEGIYIGDQEVAPPATMETVF